MHRDTHPARHRESTLSANVLICREWPVVAGQKNKTNLCLQVS
jgi:hypothetical protein